MQAVVRWLSLGFTCAALAACSTPPSASSSKYATNAAKTSRGIAPPLGLINPSPSALDRIPDAVPALEPLHASANRPYEVMGQTFQPETKLRPYHARGMASWYGKKFHGRRTASGEPYDMYEMTAAHPTLPIPSYARVTNVDNGKSVIVRINDRGPFHKSRLIDLSYTAANKLGFVDFGSAEVVVERVRAQGEADTGSGLAPVAARTTNTVKAISDVAQAPLPSTEGIWLQLGAFGTPSNAEAFRQRMATLAQNNEVDGRLEVLNRDGIYRVRIGPFLNVNRARDVGDRLQVQTVVMR